MCDDESLYTKLEITKEIGEFQHEYNPLHFYCRLVDYFQDKKIKNAHTAAKRITTQYEGVYETIQELVIQEEK